ncbi:glycosyl hydrolase family 18 protein [Paenibacillus sp. D2_2]|uniref:glycoside hydrolase family 18 protein n=1 Tax=Paenibacillus sp. D2_2 TaxID=3073092 RepID=UPI002814C1B2|nr:glycosyl hydrolase family 18 protein [Paenibacillus sp. D2_2]WMT43089.1 glycosyl hydrolase family 18 protein [Paenibacillus sp. D2_2]
MKISLYTKVFVIVLLAGMGLYFYQISSAEDHKVVAVYVEAWRDADNVRLSDKNVDIAYIAFAKIAGTRLYFHEDEATNEQIKRNIQKMKENNPTTRFVLAIGGYGVDGFSDATMDENRYLFTESIVEMIRELKLDGVDIDWEYPAFHAWNTQKSRPEDTQNFTSLMKELKEKMYRLPFKNKGYLLTFAAGTQDWYFQNVEVQKVAKYVDYINVMSYDLIGQWSDQTGFNANLFMDRGNKSQMSVDQIITMYLDHDIDSKKLLLGIPAYSYAWKNVKNSWNDGAFAPGQAVDIEQLDFTYKVIQKSYMNKNGYKRYFDDQAKAAYLYNGETFITYEDTEALVEKVKYIHQHDLGGAMVWEYSQDAEDGIVKFLGDQLRQ